jgi:hypothetical protein
LKRLFITGSAKVVDSQFGNCKASKLLSILQLGNFELTSDAQADYLLAIDHNAAAYKAFISAGGSPKRAILIRLEPPTVFPAQYRKSVEKRYGLLFTPGSILQSANDFVGWPYQIHSDPNVPSGSSNCIEDYVSHGKFDYTNWMKREVFLSMIAANKVAPAFGQNYKLRRKFAKSLRSVDFHLYGSLWSCSMRQKLRHRLAVAYFAIRHRTIPSLVSIYGNLFFKYERCQGFVGDKHQVLTNSKFSLVIENSDTYVSEKIFDSMINGCIPVYFGPKLAKVGMPADIAIYYGGSANEILKFLADICEDEIKSKLDSISQFLNSENFKNSWFESNVYQKIAGEIVSKIAKA